MRASHQLVEWILGRQAQVEVLKPEKLRNYVAKKIGAMQRLYT
jgi:predicted DNA-binding transcriptional regulator YafY